MELYLDSVFKKKKNFPLKINWTDEMLKILYNEFPFQFNYILQKKLGICKSTLINKAHSLGLQKESGFLDKNRKQIVKLSSEALKRINLPGKGIKGWSVPNSEKTRFKKGQVSIMKIDETVRKKMRLTRIELIRKERIRIKACLPQKTKLKLN